MKTSVDSKILLNFFSFICSLFATHNQSLSTGVKVDVYVVACLMFTGRTQPFDARGRFSREKDERTAQIMKVLLPLTRVSLVVGFAFFTGNGKIHY